MNREKISSLPRCFRALALIAPFLFLVSACSGGAPAAVDPGALQPAALAAGAPLQVVVSTSIAADVVSQVGGDHIRLSTLIPVPIDPHAYQPSPSDLKALQQADVFFISGAGLEEGLLRSIAGALEGVPIVSLSSGIRLRTFDGDGRAPEGEEGGVDPHVWFDPNNVMHWTQNAHAALSALDPQNAADYTANAGAYKKDLQQLDSWIREQTAAIPFERRKLVSDHLAFGYFADRYGFEMIGALIPAYSTTAQASSRELAALAEKIEALDVPAVFVSVSANPRLAEQIASETGVAVVPLYIGSLSPPDGPAADYLSFMRYDVGAIVAALR